MAEGLLRYLDLGEYNYDVASAGTAPSFVHPKAIGVMTELEIDISNHRSKHVKEFTGQSFDYVISLCGEDNCPSFVGRIGTSLHWPFPDPVSAAGIDEDALAGFRKVRDDIRNKLEKFMADPSSFRTDGPEFSLK
jgi:arsenate reductase